MNRQRFEVLDGWRGICALLVALYHFNAYGHFYTIPFVRNAWLFVDFFFVLSGFVITHAYGDRLSDWPGIRVFIVRRFGRLWPLHIAVLSCFVALEAVKFLLLRFGGFISDRPAFSGDTSLESIVTNILLIHALGIHNSLTWNGPSWSISTEFYAYVVFAALCWGVRKKSGLLLGAIAITLAILAIIFLFSGSNPNEDFRFSLIRCLYGFFIGHLTYRIWKSGENASTALQSKAGWAMLEAAASALVVGFVSIIGCSGFWLAAPVVFAFAIWVFAHEGGYVSRIMKTRAVLTLGVLSYSIYMVHELILTLFARMAIVLSKLVHVQFTGNFSFPWEHGPIKLFSFGNQWMMDGFAVVYLIAVIAVAAFTHKTIERPGMRFFNALAANKDDDSTPSASTPVS